MTDPAMPHSKPTDLNADSPEFREARMPETRTTIERIMDASYVPSGESAHVVSYQLAKTEIERLTQRLAEVEGWAKGWHRAVDTAATILELPHAVPSPSEFTADVQEHDRAMRAQLSALQSGALGQALDLLREWNRTSLDPFDGDEHSDWCDQFERRIDALLSGKPVQSGEARKALQELVRLSDMPPEEMTANYRDFLIAREAAFAEARRALASLDTKP